MSLPVVELSLAGTGTISSQEGNGVAAPRVPQETLIEKVQRIADLQDERHQRETLPDRLCSAGDAVAGIAAPPLSPACQECLLEIEAEIERLQEEIVAGEADETLREPEASPQEGAALSEPVEAEPTALGREADLTV